MPANTSPIFSASADVTTDGTSGMSSSAITTAVGDYTGISANYKLVFTAGLEGGYIQRLRFKAIGTNIASVARIFINNGSTQGTASNNTFYGEISLPATTASNTTSTIDLDYPMGFAINGSFKIYVGVATTVASGWIVTAIGSQY